MNTDEQNNTLLHTEFIEFMKKHSVYETIPENMKVNLLKKDSRIQ